MSMQETKHATTEPAQLAAEAAKLAGRYLSEVSDLAATLCDHLRATNADLDGPAISLAVQIGLMADAGALALGASPARGGVVGWLLSPAACEAIEAMQRHTRLAASATVV